MTTVRTQQVTCALCSTVSKHEVLMSTNAFGSPDLDLRPPSMERYTLSHQVQECPHCGYCAPVLDYEPVPRAREVVDLPPYQALRSPKRYPELAGRFLRAALLAEGSGGPQVAGLHALRAAWVCDDEELSEAAAECRLAAIHYLQSAHRQGLGEKQRRAEENALMVDLLRRVGRFEEASALIEQGSGRRLPDVLVQVLRYQQALIERRDTACHTIEEAAEADDRPRSRIVYRGRCDPE